MHVRNLAVSTALFIGMFFIGITAFPSIANARPLSAGSNISPILAATEFSGLSCATANYCVAVGITLNGDGTVLTTDNGGRDWVIHVLSTAASLTSVACATRLNCVAVGDPDGSFPSSPPVILTSPDGGLNWTTRVTPPHTAQLLSVTCPSTEDCFAGGNIGAGSSTVILHSVDGGVTWANQEVSVPAPGVVIEGISCASTTACTAIDIGPGTTGIVGTNDGGVNWSAEIAPTIAGLQPDSTSYQGISCPSPSDCFISGGGLSDFGSAPVSIVLATTDGGSTWVSQPVGDNGLAGISCPSTTNCEAIGNSVQGAMVGTANAGASWADQATPSAIVKVVSCPSVLTCYAIGGNSIIATVNGGSTWAIQPIETSGSGYWLVGSDGGIFSFGSAQFHGSMGGVTLDKPIVGITPTADDNGYWLVASDGGVFSFGDTEFYGSMGGKPLNKPMVGIVPSSDDNGYFMVAADGGVFAFGDAKFEGSCYAFSGGCSGAAIAVMPDASGNGYWLVTATGHVYAFGDAVYYGAPGPQFVPVTSAVRTPDGRGYWILFANGVVSNYGDAVNYGQPSTNVGSSNPATAIISTSDGGGYWVASVNGSVFSYGDALYEGGMNGTSLNGSIVAATGF